MTTRSILCLVIVLGGCAAASQDPINDYGMHIARHEAATVGQITVDFDWQDFGDAGGIHAEKAAQIFNAAFVAWTARFGSAPANLDHVHVVLVNENGDDWVRVCDSREFDGCSKGYVVGADWTIFIRSDQMNDSGLFLHEILHGLLYYANGDGDVGHATPGVWETDENSVFWDAYNAL
jgi:hypothetical protein